MLRAEGKQRGEQRGEQGGRAEVVLRLLDLKFGPLSSDVMATIHGGANIDQLDTWTARILTAGSIDETLR